MFFIAFLTTVAAAVPQSDVPGELRGSALHDSACANPAGAAQDDPSMTALPIHLGARDLGTIVTVQGACHCQNANCDTLVYLHNGQGYKLAFKEKYASLHPMKIVKRGMPSLTGQFEISAAKMETTVYDWDGKDYRPSLCATVIKGQKRPSISQHPCKSSAQ